MIVGKYVYAKGRHQRLFLVSSILIYFVVYVGPTLVHIVTINRTRSDIANDSTLMIFVNTTVDTSGSNSFNDSGSIGSRHYHTPSRQQTKGQVKVPRVIHRIWKNNDVASMPRHWRGSYKKTKRIHDSIGWSTYLWTDQTIRAFIALNYPWFLGTFDAYPYAIQRVDAARYLILHHYGGVYLDLDITCLRSIEPILHSMAVSNKTCLIPMTWPVGFSNDIMIATRSHPFINELVESLVKNNGRWYGSEYLTILGTTGPLFLSKVYQNAPKECSEQVGILHPNVYEARRKPYFFRHLRGSSWHGTVSFKCT